MESLELFPIELYYLILDFCEFKAKINFIQTCKYYYSNLYIYDLMNVESKYLSLLNDNILQQNKFKLVTKLNANYNTEITDVSFMKNLTELYGNGNCGINEKGIKGLSLVKLDVYSNTKITNVSFMKNLTELNASGSCGINQEGIEGLSLIKLNTFGNAKINNI